MPDLTPEGLRARAKDLAARLGYVSSAGGAFSPLILAAFTAPVASARADERAGLLRAFHVTLDSLGAPSDEWPCNRVKLLFVEARRAQREGGAILAESVGEEAWEAPAYDISLGYKRGVFIELSQRIAAAIRAQEETPVRELRRRGGGKAPRMPGRPSA